MVTAGIFPFKETSHGRAGNRTRDLMVSSQRLWPLDHNAGHVVDIYMCVCVCFVLFCRQVVRNYIGLVEPLNRTINVRKGASWLKYVFFLFLLQMYLVWMCARSKNNLNEVFRGFAQFPPNLGLLPLISIQPLTSMSLPMYGSLSVLLSVAV